MTDPAVVDGDAIAPTTDARGRDRGLSSLVTGAGSALGLKIIGMGVGYLFALLVTRAHGPAGWGAFTLGFTVLTLASILGRMGVDTATLRLVAARADQGREAVRGLVVRGLAVVVPASVAFGAATFLGAELIAAGLFSKPHLTGSFRLAAAGVPAVAVGLYASQALRGLHRVREYVFFDLVARSAMAALLFYPAARLVGAPSAALLSFVVGAYLVCGIGLWTLNVRIRSLGGGAAPGSRVTSTSLLRLGMPLLLAGSTIYLKGWIDTLMLGIFRSEADVGVYAVALKLATLVGLPLVAVNAVAAPRFAAAHARGDFDALRRVVHQSGTLVVLASVPAAALLILGADLWLGVFGAGMREGHPALVLLTIGFLLSAVAGSVGYLLQMTGGQIAFQNISLGVLGLNVVMNLLLVPRYGVTGAAVTTCLGTIVFNVACVWYVRARLGFWTLPFLGRFRGSGNIEFPRGRASAP